LFTSNNHLELVDKRVSTGDEEIDLVIKNNIDRPFWMAFNSPLFFVECKNWHKSVGSKEMRDFETKMRNHSKLAKLGFFVSYNGFTTEALEELKRAGREDYHIVLIKKANLLEYLQLGKPFFEWLENLVIQLH
jgi:restriction endonuclease Mrr